MINLIFNILNLSVFIFLISYAFYKYLLPSLKKKFRDYQLNLINLETKKEELILAQQDISNKIIEQDKLCMTLKERIFLWKQSIDEALFYKKTNNVLLQNKLQEKLNQQSQNYQYEQLKKRITPELVESLKENLEQHFKKAENIELYFSNIFKELN